MFRRAVQADPCHRDNLENYAYFLSEALNNQNEALYYYQVFMPKRSSLHSAIEFFCMFQSRFG